jgi:hypothetical protein
MVDATVTRQRGGDALGCTVAFQVTVRLVYEGHDITFNPFVDGLMGFFSAEDADSTSNNAEIDLT